MLTIKEKKKNQGTFEKLYSDKSITFHSLVAASINIQHLMYSRLNKVDKSFYNFQKHQ